MNKKMRAVGLGWILGAVVSFIAFAAGDPSLNIGSGGASDEVKAAMQRTAPALKENSACPTDPVEFEKMVAANWRHLHPMLDDRERQKDPAYVEAHRAASVSALSAKEILAERMKDPSFAAKRDAAAAAMRRGLVDRREAEDAAIRLAEAVRSRESTNRVKNGGPE